MPTDTGGEHDHCQHRADEKRGAEIVFQVNKRTQETDEADGGKKAFTELAVLFPAASEEDRERQNRNYFGQFRRLEGDASDEYPSPGTVDLPPEEQNEDEQPKRDGDRGLEQ